MKKGLVYTEFGTELIPNPEVYKTMDKTKCEHYLKTCAECAIDFQPCVGVEKCDKPRHLRPDTVERWAELKDFCEKNGYVPTETEAKNLGLNYSKVASSLLKKEYATSLEYRIQKRIHKYVEYCKENKLDPYEAKSAYKYRYATGISLYKNSAEYRSLGQHLHRLIDNKNPPR